MGDVNNMSPFTSRPRYSGFTLIELLVVIGIIALLIGILLPVLSSAKQAAVKVHCSVQIRSISTALEIYANDFRENYPLAGHKIGWDQTDLSLGGTGMNSWMQQLFTYLPSEEVFSGCHSYPRETPYHYFLGTRAVWAEKVERTGSGSYGSLQRLRLRHTSSYVLVGDNNWDFDEVPDADADKDDYTQPTLVFEAGFTPAGGLGVTWEPQHVKGLNVGFADNHVASFTEIDLDRMTWRYDRMSAW